MENKKDLSSVIKKMPKAELHLHLEGAFTFEFLFQLIEKYGGDPGITGAGDLEKKFIFTDFPHFIDAWIWKNRFFRMAADFEDSTYSTLRDLHEQNVIYAEVYYSPWDFTDNGLKVEEITEATISALRRARNDFGIKSNLIADIIRDRGAEGAVERIDQVTPYLNNGVIGIGLGGSEQAFPAEMFKDAFREAKKRGFRLVAHAGEAAGPESVRAAVELLGAERIGHGVRAVEDPHLVEYLNTKQIPLEVCLTSNLKTQIFPSPEAHPFKGFYQQGLNVTINSDDPAMFGSTITGEMLLLHDRLDFSLGDLKILTLKAIEASFLPDNEKEELKQTVAAFDKDRYLAE